MADSSLTPTIALRQLENSWLLFDNPIEIITASTIDTVVAAVDKVEQLVSRGLHAAGFIGYEAAPAFDGALHAYPPDEVPLLWFGLFSESRRVSELPQKNIVDWNILWKPSITAEEYSLAFDKIKKYIARGDTYQVNYTFRLHTEFTHNPWEYFCSLCRTHPMPYAGYINCGRYVVCSFSPELFFRYDGKRLTAEPMKGTADRGRTTDEDRLIRQQLLQSEKERAENVMIVDMVRNDIGRIARKSSVEVPQLCMVQQFRSLVQMTSTITGEVDRPLRDIFSALFPCASIVGAPKVRTSQIISELESTPRHCYCGTIGWYAPGRQGNFNVAIRTLLIDQKLKKAEYGTGSGIVWESTKEHEFEECLLKAAIITSPQPEFQLIETMLWTAENGYFLLERHLDRLMDSARFFQFKADRAEVKNLLMERCREYADDRYRVRLTVGRTGICIIEQFPFPSIDNSDSLPLTLFKVPGPVNSRDCFLFHKTTQRTFYEEARKRYPTGDDLLFHNELGEITETTIGNIVFEIDKKWYTPPISSGLLPGVFRASLIAEGSLQEKVLTESELLKATQIYRINSVRKWQKCVVLPNG